MKNKNRGCKKIAVFGKSRAGKSVTAEALVSAMKDNKQKKHFISHDPQNRFTDVSTDEVYRVTDFERYLGEDKRGKPICLIQNAVFIVDEAQMLFKHGRTPQYILDLMGLANENGCDWIFITHHPMLLPIRIAMYITDFFVFTTGAGSKSFDDPRVEASETLMHCMVAVKGYVKAYPRGDYGLGEYPNFPFAHIDCDRETVKFINMPEINVTMKGDKIDVTYGKIKYY